MQKIQFEIPFDLLIKIFNDLFNHLGWSEFYQKHVIVEPIWCFNIDNISLTGLVCLDSILYNFEKPFGTIIANNIDELASEFIEQAMIIEKNFLLICDNPILFPHNRLEDFAAYLVVHPLKVQEIKGIIHYHVAEKELSNEDIVALKLFYKKISKQGNGTKYLGIIISQKNPTETLKYSDKSMFINKLIDEFMEGNISISGKLFDNDKIHDVEFFFKNNS